MDENVDFNLMQLDLVSKDVKTVAINCLQWGDTGKGKIVDLFLIGLI